MASIRSALGLASTGLRLGTGRSRTTAKSKLAGGSICRKGLGQGRGERGAAELCETAISFNLFASSYLSYIMFNLHVDVYSLVCEGDFALEFLCTLIYDAHITCMTVP